jgi:hypothetical protein
MEIWILAQPPRFFSCVQYSSTLSIGRVTVVVTRARWQSRGKVNLRRVRVIRALLSASLDQDMPLESILSGERLVTVFARERLDREMDALVTLEIVIAVEGLRALITLERALVLLVALLHAAMMMRLVQRVLQDVRVVVSESATAISMRVADKTRREDSRTRVWATKDGWLASWDVRIRHDWVVGKGAIP